MAETSQIDLQNVLSVTVDVRILQEKLSSILGSIQSQINSQNSDIAKLTEILSQTQPSKDYGSQLTADLQKIKDQCSHNSQETAGLVAWKSSVEKKLEDQLKLIQSLQAKSNQTPSKITQYVIDEATETQRAILNNHETNTASNLNTRNNMTQYDGTNSIIIPSTPSKGQSAPKKITTVADSAQTTVFSQGVIPKRSSKKIISQLQSREDAQKIDNTNSSLSDAQKEIRNSAISNKKAQFDSQRGQESSEITAQAFDSIRKWVESQIAERFFNQKMDMEAKFHSFKNTISQVKEQLSHYSGEWKAVTEGLSQANIKLDAQVAKFQNDRNEFIELKNDIKHKLVTFVAAGAATLEPKSINLTEPVDTSSNRQSENPFDEDITTETHQTSRLIASQSRNSSVQKMRNVNKQNYSGNTNTDNRTMIRLNEVEMRLHKIEDSISLMKKTESNCSLPKISQGVNRSSTQNTAYLDSVKADIGKLNEELAKTNDKLTVAKARLKELYEAHSEIPEKFKDVYLKLAQVNELQEERLLELIKELINRSLTDPFNNHFTNTLKREINVKFLEIKHEYYGILKEIENKVEDKAEKKQLTLLEQSSEEGLLQVKAVLNAKCDAEDMKKATRYLETKIKEISSLVKQGTEPEKKNSYSIRK